MAASGRKKDFMLIIRSTTEYTAVVNQNSLWLALTAMRREITIFKFICTIQYFTYPLKLLLLFTYPNYAINEIFNNNNNLNESNLAT